MSHEEEDGDSIPFHRAVHAEFVRWSRLKVRDRQAELCLDEMQVA